MNLLEEIVAQTMNLGDSGMMVQQYGDFLFPKCASPTYWQSHPRKKFPSSENQIAPSISTSSSCCTYERLTCINGSSTKKLAGLKLVLKQVESLAQDTVHGHASKSSLDRMLATVGFFAEQL